MGREAKELHGAAGEVQVDNMYIQQVYRLSLYQVHLWQYTDCLCSRWGSQLLWHVCGILSA
jgi:hypothetical protein